MHGRKGVYVAGEGACMAGERVCVAGERVCMAGGVHGGGEHVWQGGHAWQETATTADGMHPTGILSCFQFFQSVPCLVSV